MFVLNLTITVLYGRRPSLQKFLVLEHLAQVPYRSWERIAQRRIARTRGRSSLARRIQERVEDARAQQTSVPGGMTNRWMRPPDTGTPLPPGWSPAAASRASTSGHPTRHTSAPWRAAPQEQSEGP